MGTYFKAWSQFAVFEGKSKRSEYWSFVLINIALVFILNIIGFSIGWTFLSSLFVVLTIIPNISVSIRRIHDINLSGWWGWLFIPLALPMFIVALIGSAKERKDNNKSKQSLSSAVINHSKKIIGDIKPAINNYVEQHNINDTNNTQSEDILSDINEDDIYEQVMIEIENNKKVKSTWAKALSKSNGDKNKAEALYIQLRVDIEIKQQIIKSEELKNNSYFDTIEKRKTLKKEYDIGMEEKEEQKEYKRLLKSEEAEYFKQSVENHEDRIHIKGYDKSYFSKLKLNK